MFMRNDNKTIINGNNFIIDKNTQNIVISHLDDNFHLNLDSLNLKTLEINNIQGNQTITLNNLENLNFVKIYNSNFTLNLGSNLKSFNNFILNKSNNVKIYDKYNVLNKLSNYCYSFENQTINIDEKYNNVNLLSFDNCKVNFILPSYNKRITLISINTNLEIKADFPILTNLRIINDFSKKLNLKGSTFPHLLNLAIKGTEFSTFIIDYHFKSLKIINIDVLNRKIILYFIKNHHKISEFIFTGKCLLSYSFTQILNEDELIRYNKNISYPLKKSANK